MPIYEFRCEKCRTDFEQLFRSMNDQPKVQCPKCGGRKVSRKLSLFGMSSARERGTTRSSGSSCSSCHAKSCSGCRR